MSASVFVLTSPSLTDMSDHINLNEARARFCAAELQGDTALAEWARSYAPPLLSFADNAPSESAIDDAAKEAREEAASDADSAHAAEIEEVLTGVEPAFKMLDDARKRLSAIVDREKAA